jgi:hypothetical protein
MRDHRTAGRRGRAASSRETESRLERAIVRALLTETRDEGTELSAITAQLKQPVEHVAAAVDVLVFVGLVERTGTCLRATGAALHLDELWRACE